MTVIVLSNDKNLSKSLEIGFEAYEKDYINLVNRSKIVEKEILKRNNERAKDYIKLSRFGII